MGSVDYPVTGQRQLLSLTIEKEKQDLSALVERLLNSTRRTQAVWETLKPRATLLITTLSVDRNALAGQHLPWGLSARGRPARSDTLLAPRWAEGCPGVQGLERGADTLQPGPEAAPVGLGRGTAIHPKGASAT